MRKRKVLALIVALCMVLSVATAGHAVLKAVGPTSSPVPPGDGFPLWYQDTTNLVLDLCLPDPGAERAGGYCLTLPADFPSPNDPVAFPGNYAGEGFWWSAGTSINLPGGGTADLVLALEAAFASGEVPINGDQVSFGRVRVRVDGGVAGTYTVTYPYGVLTFEVAAADVGTRSINATSDIGIGNPGDFSGALLSAIGPFLVAADCTTGVQQPFFADPAIPGKQYLADPGLPTCVIGGTQFNTTTPNVNTFRVVGPANAFGPGVDTVETNQFNITGRRFLGTPIVLDRATYTRTAGGAVSVDVFGTAGLPATAATATSGATVDAPMAGIGGNRLFTHLELGAVAVPASASITAAAADPFVALLPPGAPVVLNPTTVSAALQDLVTITTAQYNLATNQLTILAASSDQDPVNGPTLTEQFLQSLAPPVAVNNGTITVVNGVTVPPAEVVVNSTAGGASTKPVEIINVTATGVLGYYKDAVWVLDLNGSNITEATDASYTFGFPGAIPVVGDWTGSGRIRIGVYDNGTWYLDTNGNGKWDGEAVDTKYTFGFPGAVPVVGDWAGTGSARIGVYQNGTWYIDFDGNGLWDNEVLDRKYTFGFPGAVPVVGKWNGAAASRIGVYSAASWYLDVDGDGIWDGGVTDVLRNFGFAGATPVVGDWTRSGQERIGVYSAGSWYLDLDNNGAWDGDVTDRLVNGFGGTGFLPVTGNW